MADNKNEEFIEKLNNIRENLKVALGILKTNQQRLEKGIELTETSKALIDNMLYDLTGNDFYLNKHNVEGKNENRQ